MVAQIALTHTYTNARFYNYNKYIEYRKNRLSIARSQKIRRIAISYSVFIHSKLLHKNIIVDTWYREVHFFFIPSSFLRIIYSVSIHMRTRKWHRDNFYRAIADLHASCGFIHRRVCTCAHSPIINYRDFWNEIAQNAVNCPREIHF